MSQQSEPKKFIFNEKIDQDYLYSLYEDDFGYIEEVFAMTLENFDPDFDDLVKAYNGADLDSLKKAAHKIKPVFGFAGLPKVQEQCREFEDLCQKSSAIDDVSSHYQQIVATLAESKKLIESEHQKLKAFNDNPL